jgi:hypothetical protein
VAKTHGDRQELKSTFSEKFQPFSGLPSYLKNSTKKHVIAQRRSHAREIRPGFSCPEQGIHVFILFAHPETGHLTIGIAAPFMIRSLNPASGIGR